ncbi:MAG: transcriptional regulator [Dehalococcoidales bacterium]|nr:MAG: transcriptional regulator [Dehalococcoidales bacterium]
MLSPDSENRDNHITGIDRIIHEPARYLIMAYLSVAESADAIFLQRQTGLTWGNLSSHLSKLELAGYVAVIKDFLDKKPHTMLQMTEEGRKAFYTYRDRMKQVLEELPGG